MAKPEVAPYGTKEVHRIFNGAGPSTSIRGFRLGRLRRTTFALFYQNYFFYQYQSVKELAVPTVALAKVGGGDGN
jgi:hypothetical protein